MFLQNTLNFIERTGNRLPHPTILFVYLCLFVFGLSALLSLIGVSAVHPVTGQVVEVKNLASGWGLREMLLKAVKNFTGFAPVGTVIVAMLGIGFAEHSGLISALLKGIVAKANTVMVTSLVVFAGVMSSIAADAGYVVLIPLAGLVFHSLGRAPLAGMAAAFAGVSGGFSANLVLGPVDVILSGLSTEALKADPSIAQVVSPAANYYFMIASVLFVTLVATFITEKVVIPNLDAPQDTAIEASDQALNADELKGIKYSALALLGYLVLLAAVVVPESGLLRDPETQSILKSPFMSGIVVVIAVGFAIAGSVYGFVTKSFQSGGDWVASMEKALQGLASYLVLMFFAAQFVAWFSWSGIGPVISITGANALQNADSSPYVILLAFILLTACINLFVGSMSAKWAVMAPVFVPMLALAGISPEITQVAYRIGDSSTNIITPLMPYFPVVIAFMQRYQPDIKLGTLIAMMLPYSVAFLMGWSVFLGVWLTLGIPLGVSGS